MKKINLKKFHIVVIVLGIIFVNFSIFHSNLWFDEAYSVGMASHNFGDIWNIGGHDVHPVLYYWILHIISIFTNGSIMAYRIFSGISITILGILGYTHIRKDFGEKVGLIFSFLIYFSPVSAIYANEIRMYACSMLLITILAIYAYRLTKTSKISYWIIFGFSSLISIYMHYYGLMAAGIINIILLIYFIKNKNKKSYIIQMIIGIIQAILYIPWLIYFTSQLNTMATNGFWITIRFPETLIDILSFAFVGNISKDFNKYLGLVIGVISYIYLFYLIKKNGVKTSRPAILSTGVYILVILAAWLISLILGTDILYYRYLIVVTGLTFFAISYMFSMHKDIYTIIFCVIILILGIYNNIILIKDNYDVSNLAQIKYLKENIKKGDVIAYANIGNGSVFAVNFPDNKQYFYNEANWGVREAYKAFGPQMDTYITKDFLDDEECQGRIWVITSQSPGFYEKEFNNENYKLISRKAFNTAYQNYGYQVILVEKVK